MIERIVSPLRPCSVSSPDPQPTLFPCDRATSDGAGSERTVLASAHFAAWGRVLLLRDVSTMRLETAGYHKDTAAVGLHPHALHHQRLQPSHALQERHERLVVERACSSVVVRPSRCGASRLTSSGRCAQQSQRLRWSRRSKVRRSAIPCVAGGGVGPRTQCPPAGLEPTPRQVGHSRPAPGKSAGWRATGQALPEPCAVCWVCAASEHASRGRSPRLCPSQQKAARHRPSLCARRSRASRGKARGRDCGRLCCRSCATELSRR